MEPYVYKPLNGARNIHILRILSGEDEDPIRISLREVSLDDLSPYYAVSYTWQNTFPDTLKRDGVLSSGIQCDGKRIETNSGSLVVLWRIRASEYKE